MLEHFFIHAKLLSEQIHDFLIGLAFEQWFDNRFTPLERSIGRGHRSVSFELRRRRQEVHSILSVMHHSRRRRIRVDHH